MMNLWSIGNWNIHLRIFNERVSLFQFPIKPQICRKWPKKYYPKDKLNKSTRCISLIYFSMAQFNDNIEFPLWNLNINNLELINFHISLIRKDFFRSFDRHSDKTAIISELLQDINNFSNKIVDVIRKSHEFSFKIVRVITIVVSNPVNFSCECPLMTSEHCLRILDDVKICRHLAVESRP